MNKSQIFRETEKFLKFWLCSYKKKKIWKFSLNNCCWIFWIHKFSFQISHCFSLLKIILKKIIFIQIYQIIHHLKSVSRNKILAPKNSGTLKEFAAAPWSLQIYYIKKNLQGSRDLFLQHRTYIVSKCNTL